MSNNKEAKYITWGQLVFQGADVAKIQVADFVEVLNKMHEPDYVQSMLATVDAIEKKEIWEKSHGFCHSCGESVKLEEVIVEQFVSDGIACKFPVHKACCEIRDGLNPFEVVVSMKFGYWLMMVVQGQKNVYKKWLPRFMEDWTHKCGKHAEVLLAESGVPYAGSHYITTETKKLVYSIRRMYLDDRERPKYAVWATYDDIFLPRGVEARVLDWDGTESWEDFYKKQKDHYKKFKAHRKRDAANRKIGKPTKLKSSCWKRGGKTCHFCRGPVLLAKSQADHITAHSKGGTNEIWNFLPIHRVCNGLISAYPSSELITSMLMGRWMIQKIFDGVDTNSWEHQATHRFLSEKL